MEGQQVSAPILRPRGKKLLKAKSRYDLRSYQMQREPSSTPKRMDLGHPRLLLAGHTRMGSRMTSQCSITVAHTSFNCLRLIEINKCLFYGIRRIKQAYKNILNCFCGLSLPLLLRLDLGILSYY